MILPENQTSTAELSSAQDGWAGLSWGWLIFFQTQEILMK